MPLDEYKKLRDFTRSPEPAGSDKNSEENFFVVHEHDASHLHYDLRLSINGVLRSWAVPKEPPEKEGIKRFAFQTEDHPLEYADFEGTIPEGMYGAGTVRGITFRNSKRSSLTADLWSQGSGISAFA